MCNIAGKPDHVNKLHNIVARLDAARTVAGMDLPGSASPTRHARRSDDIVALSIIQMLLALVLASFLVAPIAPPPARGQNSPAPQTSREPRPDVNLSVNSTLVVIPVTITDASNRFVLGLQKQNFAVFEDGVQQKITQFAAEDAPLSIGLLVDTSGSMGLKLATSRQAAAEILKSLNPSDEAFLLHFSDRPELDISFTNNFGEILDKLGSIESQGLTALLDAIEIGVREMKKAANPRKALLIISDGGDNNSRYTSGQIEDVVRQADVQVYAMGVFEPFSNLGLSLPELSGPRLLAEVCQQTGGRAFPARSFSVLPAVARKIAIELRNQYVLAYAPARHDRDGKYRKVEVKLSPPPGLSGLKARWRSGYFAPSGQ
jgi:Ca-activated chloride channel family protein